MEHTRFVGLDIHKERISIAVTESGRVAGVEYLSEISNDPGAIGKLCDRLGRPDKTLAFCDEAGPCGYGVHRQLTSRGHRCDVVAPSLIPTKPGDRVKTDRRDATMLARLHRAGELTPVWVPDADHEAMRDLIPYSQNIGPRLFASSIENLICGAHCLGPLSLYRRVVQVNVTNS
jgi:transposase